MKTLLSCLLLMNLSFTVHASSDQLREIQKKHRAERHEENKKWKASQEECYKKFPKHYETSHADYDAAFKCREDIGDAKAAFEDKQNAELCEKVNIKCKKNDKPE